MIGDRDFSPVGACGLGRRMRNVAHFAFHILTAHQPNLGRVARLDVLQVTLVDLADRQDRIESEQRKDRRPGTDRTALGSINYKSIVIINLQAFNRLKFNQS